MDPTGLKSLGVWPDPVERAALVVRGADFESTRPPTDVI
jgi:hypothetical protein